LRPRRNGPRRRINKEAHMDDFGSDFDALDGIKSFIGFLENGEPEQECPECNSALDKNNRCVSQCNKRELE